LRAPVIALVPLLVAASSLGSNVAAKSIATVDDGSSVAQLAPRQDSPSPAGTLGDARTRNDLAWLKNVRVDPPSEVPPPIRPTPPPLVGTRREVTVRPGASASLIADDASLELRILPGAVQTATRIGMQRRQLGDVSDPSGAFFRVAFDATDTTTGAEVHSFPQPLAVELKVPAGVLAHVAAARGWPVEPDEVQWWQYDENAGWLDQHARFDPSTGMLRVLLHHFSDGAEVDTSGVGSWRADGR